MRSRAHVSIALTFCTDRLLGSPSHVVPPAPILARAGHHRGAAPAVRYRRPGRHLEGTPAWSTGPLVLHQGPGGEYAVVGHIPDNTRLVVSRCSPLWCVVEAGHQKGWSRSGAISFGVSSADWFPARADTPPAAPPASMKATTIPAPPSASTAATSIPICCSKASTTASPRSRSMAAPPRSAATANSSPIAPRITQSQPVLELLPQQQRLLRPRPPPVSRRLNRNFQ